MWLVSPDPTHTLLLQKWIWLTRLQWNLSDTDTLKTTMLVLISELGVLISGGNNIYVKFRLSPSVLISGISFERGSTVFLLKLRRPQHLEGSINTFCLVHQCQVTPLKTIVCLVLHEITTH